MAMAAAAIPLIIHLFNFRKPKRINFSSLAFLQELQKSTMQRVRIKQWLLLALRTLAIAALVLAFSRPTMTGSLPGLAGRSKSSKVIVFDNSTSMTLRDGDGAYLEQARNVAAAIVDDMDAGDEIFVLQTISAAVSIPPLQNISIARQAVMNVSLRGGEMILSDAVRRAATLLETSANPNREIYVLSDLQKSTFTDSTAISTNRPFPEDVRVFLLPVGDQPHDNIAISEIQVLSRILSVGQVVRMEVSVENFSDRKIQNLVVSLFLEDDRVAQATVDVGAGQIARVPIAVTPRETGWLKGRVEIQDSDYEPDDTRALTLFVPEERRLLLVEGSAANSDYLKLALSSDMTARRVQFNMTQIAETALASVSLGQFDTVILNGVTDLSSGERSSVSQYIRDGGGVLVFPAEEIVLADYNSLLTELGGGKIGGIAGGDETDVSIAVFDQIDHEHALFEGMFEQDQEGSPPQLEQPEVFRTITYQPGAGNEQSLIRMSGGHIFLQEIRSGLGSLMLYSVAPDLSWTDFPVRGLFIPLLYRSIYYLSAAGSVTGDEFVVGSSARLRFSGLEGGAQIAIEGPLGSIYLPELRRVPGGLLASIEAGYLQPGVYDVKNGDEIIRRISVHPERNESELATYSNSEAKAVLQESLDSAVAVVDLSNADADQLQNLIQTARTGVELWNVFLLLALFSLIAEMIIEKRWRPESA